MNWDQIELKWAAMTGRVRPAFDKAAPGKTTVRPKDAAGTASSETKPAPDATVGRK